MKKLIGLFLFLFASLSVGFCQDDAEGSKDPALFTRMPNHYIYNYIDHEFDKYDFPVGTNKTLAVEGHFINITYYSKENTPSPSGLQIIRNYSNAIKKIGGKIVFEFEDGGWQNSTMKLVKDGKEVWAHTVAAGNGQYSLYIVEKQAMEQDVVADASSMANSIKETGKVALYGIYFDTGKATLKPESDASLQEIAKLLKSDPALKLYVVGHTDNTGGFDANMKLSMDRAAAVVNALLTKHSVSAAGLKACGDGPTAPVATNDTEEGKALNRRVELVKQ